MPDFAAHVAQFVGLIGIALIVGLAAERLRVPYSVALLVVGIALSSRATVEPLFAFPQGLLFVFLPALVFEAALQLDAEALLRRWLPIAVLAVPGVVFSAGSVALGAAFSGLPLEAAFVLGAIVAATDPVAVIATFRRLTVPLDVQTIVEAESLANDGVAVVLGLISARLFSRLLRGTRDGGFYAVASLVLAYGSYLVADRIHASGIFACATAGIALAAPRRSGPPAQIMRDLQTFWAALAFLANSLVFLFMGFALDLRRVFAEPRLIIVTLIAVFATRTVLAYGALPLSGLGRRYRGWHHVVAWAGLRGGLALALALNLPASLPGREQIIDATFAVVLVTLVLQGLTIEPLLRRLRLYGGNESGGP